MHVKTLVGEQWDLCERCGLRKPMSKIAVQKGLRVCTDTCLDNLVVEQRDAMIGRILESGQDEGADLRYVDQGFNNNIEETTF